MSFHQNFDFYSVKHVGFCTKKVYLQGILLHYFLQKKSATEAHRVLVENYGNHALLETACRDWFRCFKNNDFDIEDKKCFGALKKFEDKELMTHIRCKLNLKNH